ncbi:MAG: hypothetical protein J6M34_08045 [Clostridia bacterium]|nr:hypothetical protein [Clostridia bacterium]
MKKVLLVFITVFVLFTGCACSQERTEVSDYQFIYDGIVKEWNKQGSPDRDTLLGFGEYLYNSHLLLFPRETPSTLEEFYFHWTPGFDVDGYAIYFTCNLNEERYTAFSDGLKNFKLQNGGNEIAPRFDDTHFEFPTYILQWTEVGKKWEVLEYVMLDEKNNTAVFVYTMSELDYIEKNSAYNVTPSERNFLDENFSIYDNFENSTYDISFLESLE